MRMELIQPFINAADAVLCESLQSPTKIADVTMDDEAYRRKGVAATDRKSTRLNSSHDQISYAVFCLKKKNILIRIDSEDCDRANALLPLFLHIGSTCALH